MTALLSAAHLRKSFGPTDALLDAGFEIESGQVIAVMGPSGSGKSTLLHCLAGITKPDEGEVRYRGSDLALMSDDERTALRRNEFGFIFQFGQLVPELSCVENVALPLRLGGMKRKKAENVALSIMAQVEVDDLGPKRPGEVSGGQGQRVAIARALVTRPKVIFADEPTGALDTLNGEKIMSLLVDSAKQAGAAVVLVTHEPRVAAYSDSEVIVRDGRTRQVVPA